MSWAKLDDRFHENRKVRGLWRRNPAALGLHVMALTYCAGHETDGVVDVEFVEDKVPGQSVRAKMTQALVDAGMWVEHENGWLIHDFLDFHPSRAALEERRKLDRERKSRGGRNGKPQHSDGGPSGIRVDSERNPAGVQASSESPDPTRPDHAPPTPQGEAIDFDHARARLKADADAIDRVWDAYVAARVGVFGKQSTPKLSRDRRDLIARRLKEWSEADLVDAVRGWRHIPHNRGENDRHTPYCDLKLLLRDAGQIERFRDAERSSATSGTGRQALAKLLQGPQRSAKLQAALDAEDGAA